MKKFTIQKIVFLAVLIFGTSGYAQAQLSEWRLNNATFTNVDPDGAGPATGSATFTLQIHTTSGSIPLVTGISTG